ncbi:quercetin dioxygenase-like cupin family protein [Methylorubrum rhodesianum]|nr:quercetin dioxygenase-like cupin family protein [Methylorubrum rhodesianum]MBI1691392.1 cupin domain-containing protein [Methylorubrum sp. DB1722]
MRIPVGFLSLVLAGVMAGGTVQPSAAGPSDAAITVQRSGSQPSAKGSPEWFTGSVRVDPLLREMPPSRMSGGLVTFEPGARTAWHTHPLGQTLIVTAGAGRVQQWGGQVQEIRPGDVVRIPPGVKHWHGASATAGMSHVAIAEALDGKVVDWMEHVTDAQYRGE